MTPDDEHLVIDYLLGSAPGEDAERLDERSITDDEFAARLRAAENDLVDAYARGELKGETLARFESFYLASARRREKVKFAESLHARVRPSRRPLLWSMAAAAAVLLLSIAAYFASPPHQVQQTLPKQSVAVMLLPQMRGVTAIRGVPLPSGTDSLEFQLKLESDDFPVYRVALRDPRVNRIVWRSDPLKPRSGAVSITVPPALFRPQNYALELTGGAARESVGIYAFRIVDR